MKKLLLLLFILGTAVNAYAKDYATRYATGTALEVVTPGGLPALETDPLSVHLDQTTPQTVTASPVWNWGTPTRIPYYSGTKTLTDDADLTFDGTTVTSGGFSTTGMVNCAELYNSAGTLKIMPDVQGDVGLFGDTDVANGADGKTLSINRRAAEGDTYLNLYINDDQVAYIDSNWDISIRSNLAGGVIELGAIPTNIVRLIGTTNCIGEPSGTENLPLRHYGYITNGANQRYVTWLLDDADDFYHLTRSNAAILGFKVDMPIDFTANTATPAVVRFAVNGVGADYIYATNNTTDADIPSEDGFKIRWKNTGIGLGANNDVLIFEKTDANDADPDGAIQFVMTGSDGVQEVAGNILGTGDWDFIANNLTTTGTGDFGTLITPYAQVVTVAKSGADFATIQGAINSIVDATSTKRYCVKVQSGVYTEAVTMKDYVDIQGAGRTNTIISGTSGTVLTFSGIHCTVMDIGVNVNYGTIGADSQAIVSSGADSAFLRCDITVTKSAGDKLMTALAVSGGSFRMMECYFAYSITGATVGSALVQEAVAHSGASTIFLLHSNEIVMTCNDTNDELVGFATVSGSTGSWLLENNIINIDGMLTATGVWVYGTATGATIARNRITVDAAVAYGIYSESAGGTAVVDTRHNGWIITGAFNRSAYIGTGDTWNSTFDKITATGGYTDSLGTVNFCSSPSDGTFTATGTITGAILLEGANAVPNATNNLSFFAATTSAQLAGVISNETGTDKLVYNTSPALVTPAIGAATGASLVLTGTADTEQLQVKGVNGQGDNIFEVCDFNSADLFTIDASGNGYFTTTKSLQFGDAFTYINQGTDGHLDLYGDVSIDMNTPVLNVTNGATSAGVIAIYEDSTDGTNNATFTVPTLAADTDYTLPADDGAAGEVLSTNGAGVLDWIAAGAGGATAWDDIGDPDADTTIALAGYETTLASTLDEANHVVLKIDNTDADLANNTYLLVLEYTDDNDANAYFLDCRDNNGDSAFSVSAGGMVDFAGGNIIYVPLAGDIETYVTAATAGDTLVLAAGTYTVTDDIDITKAINIKGQGIGQTILSYTSAAASDTIINGTASNITIKDLTITGTSTGTTQLLGIWFTGTAGTVLTGCNIINCNITITGAGAVFPTVYDDASGTMRNCVLTETTTGTNKQTWGVLLRNAATAEAVTTLYCYNVYSTATGTGTGAVTTGFYSFDSSASQDCLMYLYNCSGYGTGAATLETGAYANGGDAYIYAENCTFQGDDYDITQVTSATFQTRNCTLVNGTTSGTITPVGTMRYGNNTPESETHNFSIYSSDGVERSYIQSCGGQAWLLHSGSGGADVGEIGYTTPNGNPAIAIYTGTPGAYVNQFNMGRNVATYVAFHYSADTLGSSGLNFEPGGDIGIRTTAPDRALEVNTGAAATGGIRITYNDSNGSAATYGEALIDSGGDLNFGATGKDFKFGSTADTTGNSVHVIDGGADNKPGVLVLYDDAGNDYFLWVSTAGDLRGHTDSPSTGDDDALGVIIADLTP